jgi:hypothetical protein
MALQRIFSAVAGIALLISLNGCTTTGYHHAKNPNLVHKWDVTVTAVSPQNIYNTLGASLVGPLASVESVGVRVSFITAEKGEKVEIVQPADNGFLHLSQVRRFDLKSGQSAIYIIDRGQVWVQPTDFPLPSEFNAAPRPASLPAPQLAPSPSSTPEAKAPDVPSSNPAPTQPKNPTEKLRELNALFKEGLINKTEYEARKKAILDAM